MLLKYIWCITSHFLLWLYYFPGEPLTQKAHQQLERVKSNHTSSLSKPNITTTASSSKSHPLSATSKPHPSTGSSSSSSSRLLAPTASSSKSTGSSKSKSTSPRPLKSANDKSTPNKTKSITYKSQTPPPCIKQATAGKKGGVGGGGGPVNFQELLKLAQKNKKSGLAGSSLSSEKRGDETSKQQTGGPTKAGIGKALLDKQWRDKRKPPFEEKKATTPHNTATQERIEASTSGASKPVTSGAVADTGRPTNGRTGAVAERVYPYELPYGERRRPGASSTELGRVGGWSRGQMAASGIRKQTVTGQPNGRGRGDQPIARGSGASSSIGRGGSNLRGSRPKSFYGRGGVPSSARLITDGPRGRSSSSASSMHYKSSWVDEMRDYVYNNPLELDEYEDGDDDLEDFVVDSYEDEGLEDGAEDYSSAIQEIFGSRYRTRVADEDDDVLMESSFAQQQFEEYRR